jgi:hypothetical protein
MRAKDSGRWFLKKFQDWIEGTSSKLMLCHGMRILPDTLIADSFSRGRQIIPNVLSITIICLIY